MAIDTQNVHHLGAIDLHFFVVALIGRKSIGPFVLGYRLNPFFSFIKLSMSRMTHSICRAGVVVA
jgi:hypothetical protein